MKKDNGHTPNRKKEVRGSKRRKPLPPEPLPSTGLPGPDAKVNFADVKRALETTRSVSSAAALLGVSQAYLSKYLNRKSRKAWWESLKRNWAILYRREYQRRRYWRTRYGCEPPPLRYDPNWIGITHRI